MPSGEIAERIVRAYKDDAANAEEQVAGTMHHTSRDTEIIDAAAEVWEMISPDGRDEDEFHRLAFVMGVHVGFKAGSDA